jgi:hypothetical protein
MALKKRISDWLNENAFGEGWKVTEKDVQQTNISFRKTSYRAQYYWQCRHFISSYTMKRWLEIANDKSLWDSWKTTHGDWYWLKNNRVVV